ncbi:MAG: RHS repeat-associated core domain-containing protein [Candidatus Acidiferrum sp.]
MNLFSYDAESRLTQVDAGATATYIYDADGRRVRKTAGGVSVDYLYDLAGHQIAELNSSGGWNRGEVYAGGRHLATYDVPGNTTVFIHSDWLGTERVRSDVSGIACESIQSLPFGDGMSTTGSCSDVSPMHLTGKERDTESGNDYFGARYYASTMGRFLSPDWSAKVEPVPYSKLDDPQTLNLYSYVRNNPLGGVDPDGHYFVVGAHDQRFYQKVLTDLYRRPGGRALVTSLANSDRPVLLDRQSFDTANTGTAGKATALAVSGQPGVAGVHVSVGTDADLMAGAKMAPGKVSPDVTTGHELEHANDGITAGQNSLQAGAAAMAAGDAPTSPGANNTVGGTAQSRAETIMGEKTDMSGKEAGAAVRGILQSGNQQWQNSANRSNICSQNQGACH